MAELHERWHVAHCDLKVGLGRYRHAWTTLGIARGFRAHWCSFWIGALEGAVLRLCPHCVHLAAQIVG